MELGVTAVMLPELDFDEQRALCARLGVKYYQYRPRVIGADQRDKPYSNWGNHKFDLTPQRLVDEGAELTRQLRGDGLEPWGTVPALTIDADDDDVERHLDGAVAAEAKCVRCGPPAYPKQPFDYAKMLEEILARYRQIVERFSGPRGIKLIIETHANSLATSPGLAYLIVREFEPAQVGVIFDLPNFAKEGRVTPALAVSVLRDHIDCVHVGAARLIEKDEPDALGNRQVEWAFCGFEEGDLHMPTWLQTLKDAGVSAPLIIEDFTAGISGTHRLERSVAYLKRALGTLG